MAHTDQCHCYKTTTCQHRHTLNPYPASTNLFFLNPLFFQLPFTIIPSGDCFYDFVEDNRALRDVHIKVHGTEEFKAAGFAAMTSYIVDGKTEGSHKAAELTLPDIYHAPYVMPAEDQALKDAKPLVYPQRGESLLYYKPSANAASGELSKEDCDAERGREREASAARPRSQSLVTYHKTPDKVVVGSLTDDFVKIAVEHVAMRQPKDLGPGKVYRLSIQDMFAECYRFISVRPHMLAENGPITKGKSHILRFWFRWHSGWLLCQKEILNLLFTTYRLVPTGLIPCDMYAEEQAAVFQSRQSDLEDLSKSNDKSKKAKPDAEERKKAKAAARKRTLGPVRNVFAITKTDEFEQYEDETVYFDVRQDPYVKSVIRISHRLNYFDASTPEMQPSVRAFVELTHLNTTRAKDGDYQPTHHVIDITDRIWQSTLSKLFPQTQAYPKTDTEKGYWKALYDLVEEGSQRLVLVIFQHDEHTCTNNVLTLKDDVPDLLKDIRTAIRKSPAVFTLIRGRDIRDLIDEIVGRWRNLTRYDPLNEFFVDIQKPYINHKNIKTTRYPRFKAPARFVFENWNELARVVGIAALIEQRASMGKHVYDAKVTVVPVPGSFHKSIGFYNAFHLQAAVT